MGIKDDVSSNYLRETKAFYSFNGDDAKELKRMGERVVLITGTGRKGSIGEAIVQELKSHTYMYDDEGKYKTIVDECHYDMRDGLGAYDLEEFDTLIMCHAITHLDWIENQPNSMIHDAISINLTSYIQAVSEFVQETLSTPYRKQIIMIGSMAYNHVLNGSAPYCASKAGLAHFAKCIAWELAPKGYDVFIIHPSNTEDTPMTEDTINGLMQYRNLTREQAEQYWGASLPKTRWLQKKDIADMVMFLMSGKAEYLSGTQIEMAGGQR